METSSDARAFTPRPEVQDALLDAVERLLQRYGYRKTSVGDIAEEAGVSRATAYLYFASKETMVLCWVERRENDRLTRLRAIAEQTENAAGVRERIAALLLTRILMKFDGARPYMNTLQGLQGIDDLRAALREPLLDLRERFQEREMALVTELLRAGIAQKSIPERVEPATAAPLLVTGTNALLPANLSRAQQDNRDDVEKMARGLIGLLLDGLWCDGENSK